MYFDDIIGHRLAKRYLTNSLKKNKINHAYMFEGIDGIGKSKLAREYSSILLGIDNLDNSPDFINIYPEGSSIKISQIRDLQSDIIIKPHNKYKIYIINDSEKMTNQSQNALLKTLEEPPEYAIIILITSNKEGLLDTIKSRCEVIKFSPISDEEIKKYLIEQGIEESRATILSVFSQGSIKNAMNLRESTEFINMRDDIQNYIGWLVDKNIIEISNISSDIEKYKANINVFLDMMINYLRDCMMIKESMDSSNIINADKIVFIKNISKKINYSQLTTIIDIIEETKKKLRSNCNFSTSLQVMVLNIYEVIKC